MEFVNGKDYPMFRSNNQNIDHGENDDMMMIQHPILIYSYRLPLTRNSGNDSWMLEISQISIIHPFLDSDAKSATAAMGKKGQTSPMNHHQWPFQEPKLEVPIIYKAYF